MPARQRRQELEGGLGILEAHELAQRLGIPGQLRSQRLERAPATAQVPGVQTIAAHPSGREATTPARTNDVLPAPEGPITARRPLLAELLPERLDFLLAAEEVTRVLFRERREPGIGAALRHLR